jgi:hypothetical protein
MCASRPDAWNRTAAELHVASARRYPDRLPELEYPPGVHLRRISQQGSLKWQCERTLLSEVLARQAVGLLETEDELFEVYYDPCPQRVTRHMNI